MQNASHEGLPLTNPAAFFQRNIAVPETLRPFVLIFYEFRCDKQQLVDMHPAYASHLLIRLRGEGRFFFPGGASDRIPRTGLLAPCSSAARYVVEGGYLVVGAALTPLGWAALTSLDASRFGNRLFPAADHLGPAAEQLGRECYDAWWRDGCTAEHLAEKLDAFMQTRFGNLPAGHTEFILRMKDWLYR